MILLIRVHNFPVNTDIFQPLQHRQVYLRKAFIFRMYKSMEHSYSIQLICLESSYLDGITKV